MYEGREILSTAQGDGLVNGALPASSSPPLRPLRPLRLARITAAWAAWCTTVFGARLRLPVELCGRRWLWQPVAQPCAAASAQWACALHGSVAGQPFSCWLDSVALLLPSSASLPASSLTEEALSLLPQALAAAVLQDVASAGLAQMGAALGQRVTLERLCSAPENRLPLEQGLAFSLTLSAADEAGVGSNGSDTDVDAPSVPSVVYGMLAAEWPHPLFAALQQAAQARPAWQEMPPDFCAWPIPCAVSWRTRPLALADIVALEAGDVLLMPCMADGEALPVRVHPGRAGAKGNHSFFAARWNAVQRSVTLEAFMQNTQEYDETFLTEQGDVQTGGGDNGAQESATSLEQCRVPIHCRLGEVNVTLAELSALAPGAVLGPLDSVDAPVTLWLGSTRMGRGELVDVDGRIGVRITELLPRTGKV